MDLRSIINDEGGRPPQKQAAPVTPIQAPPQQAYRDYNHQPHASPSKHASQDYGAPANPAYSPKPYPGQYQGRPSQPPPIQPPSQTVLQSPIRSYSAQSPYQHTPSSTVSGGQYPFPPSHHQTPQSPAQHNPYPPSFQHRESYPQTTPSSNHHPSIASHTQPSPIPQTPPIGMPGAQPHTYLQHQRSQSSVSTSTPTSVHSQPPTYNQYGPHDSPVSAAHYPPPPAQHMRQQSQASQPGTPLGPPPNQRQSSGGFTQPNSPYQQRAIQPGSFSQYQTSPASVAQRLPSTPNPYDPARSSLSEQQQHRRSQSERERSLSVSPKTRIPSQPRVDVPTQQPPPQTQHDMYNSSKRKMDDREASIESPRQINQPDIKPPITYGDLRHSPVAITSSQPPMKRRKRYTEPPIWAQSIRTGKFAGQPLNQVTNGRPPAAQAGQTRPQTNGHPSPQTGRGQPPVISDVVHPSALLGPWEESISGIKPSEEIAKQTADFIFQHVVSRDDLGELSSHGVEIEIEAKLGQFIESASGERIAYGITSECIMAERRQISFRSAMTEHQHKVLNDFLNAQVKDAHPQNPDRGKRRVNIVYVHRREIDKFYELSPAMLSSLPPALTQHAGFRSARLRVTYDQKTNQILAKIIKVRIADMSIHLPKQPLDCRISVNFEMKFDGDIDAIMAQSQNDRSNDRSKDRLSYTQGLYQVDLTQVTKSRMHNGTEFAEKEHELEVEVDTRAVLDQGNRARSGQPHEYLALVEGLINNIRVLARAVPPS